MQIVIWHVLCVHQKYEPNTLCVCAFFFFLTWIYAAGCVLIKLQDFFLNPSEADFLCMKSPTDFLSLK